MTSSHPRQGRLDFCVATVGWPKRTIVDNLSSFICRTWPSHLNLFFFIIALKSGIEPHFSYNLLFEIRSVSRIPKTIGRQFLWKISSVFFVRFSERPCFRAVFDHWHHCCFQYSNLGLQSYLPILPNRFYCEKNTLSLSHSTFNIFTAPTVFINNATELSEATHLINLFVIQCYLFIFTYS